jgi:hypothetical protein
MAALAQHRTIAEQFAQADRVAERRWRLRLANGSVIELPAGQASAGLGRVVRSRFANEAIAAGNTLVDVRSPERIFTRVIDGPVSQWTGQTGHGGAQQGSRAVAEPGLPAGDQRGGSRSLDELVREVL